MLILRIILKLYHTHLTYRVYIYKLIAPFAALVSEARYP